jgi:hypothetical protein
VSGTGTKAAMMRMMLLAGCYESNALLLDAGAGTHSAMAIMGRGGQKRSSSAACGPHPSSCVNCMLL